MSQELPHYSSGWKKTTYDMSQEICTALVAEIK